MSGSILFRVPLESSANPSEPGHLTRKDYVDQAVAGRLLVGSAANDYLTKVSTSIPASADYNVNNLPVGQKTVVGRDNPNLPPGSDPYYYMESNRGDTTDTIYQVAIGTNSGHTWRRTWNGFIWTSWSRPLLLSEYVAGDATNKLDKTTGGTVVGNVRFLSGVGAFSGNVDTQTITLAHGWKNGFTRWADVIEANGDKALYSYDATGDGPERVTVTRRYDSSSDLLRYRLFEVIGGIRSTGTHAALVVEARNNPDHSWHMYADNGNNLRFWSQTANADLLSCDNGGNFTASGAIIAGTRISCGWDSGWSGSVSCSNWFRALGDSGLLFSTWGGGLHMTDATYIRTFGGKAIAANHFVSTGNRNPQISGESASYYAQGNYGGGYGMGDGAYRLSYYSVGGNHVFACSVAGGTSASVATIGRDGTIFANDYALNSDSSMKERVQPLTHRRRLEPVSYYLKPEYSLLEEPKLEIGFIADKVQETYPELVGTDRDGKLTLYYQRITALNSAHINQVEDELIATRAECAKLREELDEIRALVTALSKR